MKYVTRKVIKGKVYYYLQYKNYSKNLGSFLPNNLAQELLNFFHEVAHEEYLLLSQDIKQRFKYGGLETLESLHYLQLFLKHDLAKDIQDKINKLLVTLFTYHSNRSEGSKTSKKAIEQFAASKIKTPRTKTEREIFNSFLAFNHALSPDMKWNMKHIKHIHGLLLDDIDPLIAGKWKQEDNVAPGNQPTISHKQVPKKMKLLIEWLKNQFRKKNFYPPELALQFYCKFEQIHPFADGNGRVGRLLLNAILYKFNYPPVIFFSQNHQEHCAAIGQALKGRWVKMNKHFLKQVKKTNVVIDAEILKSKK